MRFALGLAILATVWLVFVGYAAWKVGHRPQLLVYPADWQRCVTQKFPPITAPAPGKDRTNYRTRDGGFA